MKCKLLILTLVALCTCCLTINQATAAASTITTLRGCVYNKKTNKKVVGTFVIRVFDQNGIGSAASHTTGCYKSSIGFINTDFTKWDFIEVIYKFQNRIYIQQHKLSVNASAIGFNFLGIPADTAQYDFFLDITP